MMTNTCDAKSDILCKCFIITVNHQLCLANQNSDKCWMPILSAKGPVEAIHMHHLIS